MSAFHADQQVRQHVRSLSWETVDDRVLPQEYRLVSARGVVRLSSTKPGVGVVRYHPDYQPDLPDDELIEAILAGNSLASVERMLELAGIGQQVERQPVS